MLNLTESSLLIHSSSYSILQLSWISWVSSPLQAHKWWGNFAWEEFGGGTFMEPGFGVLGFKVHTTPGFSEAHTAQQNTRAEHKYSRTS